MVNSWQACRPCLLEMGAFMHLQLTHALLMNTGSLSSTVIAISRVAGSRIS